MNRTIKIESAESTDFILENNNIPAKQFYNAIGYLSQWSMQQFSNVSLFIDSGGDITAIYTEKGSDRNYGFHS